MFLLSITFSIILLLSFVIVALMMSETRSEKAMRRRLEAIATPRTTLNVKGHKMGEYLGEQDLGPFGWLEELLSDRVFVQKLNLLIVQANGKRTAGTVLVTSASLCIFGVLLADLTTSLIVGSLTAGIICGYIPFALLHFLRNRRISAFDRALPDSIEMCTRALRAGHSMNSAFGILADQAIEPAKMEFGEVFKKQSYGLPLRDALMQMLNRVPSSDLQVFVTSVLVQKDTGGNLPELLERTVNVIRERVRIQHEIRIHTAQGRLTGWILFLLPLVMLLLLNLTNRGYSDVLFHDPMGIRMLYIGLFLLIVGGLLIRRIVNGIEV